MGTVKILHCADLHIGAAASFLGERAESRRFEALLTFERIVSLARQNDVKIILIAGDLLNSNSIEGSFCDRIFDAIASIPEIKVVFAAGNHDPLSSDSPFLKYKIPENLYVLATNDDCKTFDDLGVRVYGRSFSEVYLKGESIFTLIPPQDNYINIMCQHGDLRGDATSNYNAISADFAEKSGMDYIALGHVHKASEVIKLGESYCAYCGCPEGQGFDELGEKGVYIGEIGKGVCDLTFVPCAKRMHLLESVDISGCDSTVSATEKIISVIREKYPDNYPENLYKIVLTGNVSADADISTTEIASRLGELVYFAKVRDKSEAIIDFELLSREKSLKGIFVKNMLSAIENADEKEKEKYKAALTLGLKAFSSEVYFDENQ